VRGDRVIFAKTFGTANVETGEPVRPEMLFRLGSTTNMFTATALVGLALEGKLDLNAPVGTYIGGLPPKISQVTANQLLSHTAGLHDEAPMYGPHDDEALGKGIRSWTDNWLFTSPGKIFSYSNPGYWMAGYLVEVLSGKPYAEAMETRVFHPLGMARTTLRPMMAMTWPLALGHDETSDGKCTVARPAADNAASWPAGSIFSNMQDLARFVIAFLNDGRIDGKPVLNPKAIAMMSSPHARYPGSPRSYGYGLDVSDFRGVRTVEHGGARIGYGSFIRMAPEQRVAVIVVTNRSGGNLPRTIETAMELLLPLEPREQAKLATLPVSAEDIRRVTGVYQNGNQRLEIVAKGKELFWKRGRGPETPLVKHSDGRYGTLVIVPGADGLTEYVNTGSRTYARVP
jgi:CubicO group peptidase (beta-lactamase class C family)